MMSIINKLLARLIFNMVGIYLASYLIAGVNVDGMGNLLIVAIVFGAINLVVKPVMVFLSLPITILTFGLFYLVLNGIIIKIVASFSPLSVATFRDAIFAAIIIGIYNWLVHGLFLKDKEGLL